MTLTDEQRKNIFEEDKNAAAFKRSRHTCPYLNNETPERNYIWMAGFDTRKSSISAGALGLS
jgi:hypothetical protein